jgi:oxysterol-binding protein 1
MRIAKLHMDSQDKTRFEIHGKSSVQYHLKANHVVEAKRWFWTLNNAIQWAKDEEKEDEKRRTRDAEALRQAKIEQIEGRHSESQVEPVIQPSFRVNGKGVVTPSILKSNSLSRLSAQTSQTAIESAPADDEGSAYGSYDPSIAQNEINRAAIHVTMGADGDDDNEDGGSSRDVQLVNNDAFSITAQSAKLQLDLLASVSTSLQVEKTKNSSLTMADPAVDQALVAYESAVNSLHGLLADLLKISRDRDAYWQFRLDREADARKMWEDSMAHIVREHENLQLKIGESEDKRKRTKKALKEALEGAPVNESRPLSQAVSSALVDASQTLKNPADHGTVQDVDIVTDGDPKAREEALKQSDISHLAELSDFESDNEEFFDAIDAEEVLGENVADEQGFHADANSVLRTEKHSQIIPSFKGYKDPPRQRLEMDSDNRPKISLWVRAQMILDHLPASSDRTFRVSSNL